MKFCPDPGISSFSWIVFLLQPAKDYLLLEVGQLDRAWMKKTSVNHPYSRRRYPDSHHQSEGLHLGQEQTSAIVGFGTDNLPRIMLLVLGLSTLR